MSNDSNKPPFGEGIFNMKNMTPSMESQMALMKAIQKINIETAQALMEIQKKYMQEIAQQWSELAKTSMSQAPLAEKKEASEKVMKEASVKTTEHFQDFSAILKKSNEKIVDNIKESIAKTKKDSSKNKK